MGTESEVSELRCDDCETAISGWRDRLKDITIFVNGVFLLKQNVTGSSVLQLHYHKLKCTLTAVSPKKKLMSFSGQGVPQLAAGHMLVHAVRELAARGFRVTYLATPGVCRPVCTIALPDQAHLAAEMYPSVPWVGTFADAIARYEPKKPDYPDDTIVLFRNAQLIGQYRLQEESARHSLARHLGYVDMATEQLTNLVTSKLAKLTPDVRHTWDTTYSVLRLAEETQKT